MTDIVVTLLPDATSAEEAVNSLTEAGVGEGRISLILQNDATARAIIDDGGPLRGTTAAGLERGLEAHGMVPTDTRLFVEGVSQGRALLAVALSVILLMMPPALHRIVWAGEDTEDVLRSGGPITVAALFPLALGMSADTFVVFAHITGTTGYGAVAAAAVLLCL